MKKLFLPYETYFSKSDNLFLLDTIIKLKSFSRK